MATRRTRHEQSVHDSLVRAVLQNLATKRFRDIRADLPGQTCPATIDSSLGPNHIPDVTATGQHPLIIEVETADSIRDMHTASQWQLFAAYAARVGAEFWVVVPLGSRAAAQQRAAEIRAQVHGFWEL